MLPLVLALAVDFATPRPLTAASLNVGGEITGFYSHAPIEKIADDVIEDAVWIGLASAADLYTTSWALRECPTCFERNPLGQDAEARIALKVGTYPLAVGICYWLRRSDHNNWATAVRWVLVGVQGALAVNNSVHAIRGR